MQVAEQESNVVERFHPRVQTNLLVKLRLDGRAYPVRAKDLSMAGLSLVIGTARLPSMLTLCIPLPDGTEIVTDCQVRRRDGDTVAVEFEQLDWDDLCALARFLHPRLP